MGDKVSVYIDKKLINDIKSFCKLNNKGYLEYITEVLEARLTLDMYGDLNDKIKPKKKPIMKKVEETNKEVIVETPKTEERQAETEIIEKVVEEDKPKTKRRTLNSK